MRKPFEDEDFERIIRSRLANYEADPGETSKKVLLRTYEKRTLKRKRMALVTAGLALCFSSFLVFQNYFSERSHFIQTETYHKPVENKGLEGREGHEDNQEISGIREKVEETEIISPTDNGSEGLLKSSSETKRELLQNRSKEIAEENGGYFLSSDSLQMEGRSDFNSLEYEYTYPDYSQPGVLTKYSIPGPRIEEVFNDILIPAKRKKTKISEPVKKDKAPGKWGVYGDILTFWTYQQATPNKSDEWIVSEIGSPGMLSTDRMGGTLSMGFFYDLSKTFEAFGGLSAQLQQVNAKFKLRPLSADKFEYSEQDNTFVPRYEDTEIDLRQKLWSAGLRIGIRYYLPYANRKFWFAPSADYQKRLTDFKSQEFSVPQNQLYLNLDFGWRQEILKDLYFNFSPTLSYSMIRVTEGSEIISLTPYSWGINLGLSYRFK